ncbi:MAG: hypothetical protein HY658_06660, partial [Actinobacteria bacterium]|nr:hypothetical protein [Actinomycetota bacterium]
MGRLRGGGPGTGAWWDAALYAASAGFSLVAARVFEIPLQREWAGRSWAPYAVGAVAAVLLALRLRRRPGGAGTAARMALAVAVLVGVALVPLAAGIAERAEPGRRAYAHSEVIVTEESARLLLDGRNPYAAVLGGGLENRTDD